MSNLQSPLFRRVASTLAQKLRPFSLAPPPATTQLPARIAINGTSSNLVARRVAATGSGIKVSRGVPGGARPHILSYLKFSRGLKKHKRTTLTSGTNASPSQPTSRRGPLALLALISCSMSFRGGHAKCAGSEEDDKESKNSDGDESYVPPCVKNNLDFHFQRCADEPKNQKKPTRRSILSYSRSNFLIR